MKTEACSRSKLVTFQESVSEWLSIRVGWLNHPLRSGRARQIEKRIGGFPVLRAGPYCKLLSSVDEAKNANVLSNAKCRRLSTGLLSKHTIQL